MKQDAASKKPEPKTPEAARSKTNAASEDETPTKINPADPRFWQRRAADKFERRVATNKYSGSTGPVETPPPRKSGNTGKILEAHGVDWSKQSRMRA